MKEQQSSYQSMNIEELVEALEYSSGLTDRVKKILIVLVCCSKDYVIDMQVDVLSDTVTRTLGKVTRAYCYVAFDILKSKGFLIKERVVGSRKSRFILSTDKLKELVEKHRALKFGESILKNLTKDQENI